MRELAALGGRYRRDLVRRPAFLILGLVFLGLLGLVAAYASATPDHGRGVMLGVVLLWLAGIAAASTHALPADRSRGRAAWLRSLAPPAWKGRLAAALAGWVGVLGVGLATGVLVAAIARTVPLERATTLPLPSARSVIQAPGPGDTWGPAWTLALPPIGGQESLQIEFEVSPQIRRGVRARQARLQWRAAATEGEIDVPTRGTFRIGVPAAADALVLRGGTDVVNLRVRSARRLQVVAAPWRNLLGTTLLLALLVGAVVPVGVACSRFTSSATAGVLAMLLLGFGMLKEPVGRVFDVVAAGQEGRVAIDFLSLIGRLVPDLPILPVLGELGAGRTVALSDAALWSGAVLYTLVGLALVVCPLPRLQEAEGA